MLVAAALSVHLATICAEPPRWRLDVDSAWSDLSNDGGEWSSQTAVVSRSADRNVLALRWEDNERFDQAGAYTELHLDRALDGGSSYYVAAGRGWGATFEPETMLRLGGEASLDAATSLLADLALASYDAGNSRVLKLGLRREIFESAALGIHALAVSGPGDESALGYSLAMDWRPRGDVALRGGYTDAPEFDGNAFTDVEAASFDLTLELSESFLLRTHVLREQRDAYARLEWALGFALRQ